MTNSNTIAKSLNPNQELVGKNNYQKFVLIEKDGSRKKRIILFITNAEIREQIICNHFLSRYVQFFIEQPTGIKFVSRDSPWDFEIELSNSEKIILEITAIADEVDLFKTFKYQERISEKSNYEHIEFHELIKLDRLFPSQITKELIETLKVAKTSKNQLILNPYYGQKFIFESSINEDLKEFDKIITEAISKKVHKNHPNKENVILIVDNRTVTFELEDIVNYLNNLEDYFEGLPFNEVWLYTGYYSDPDGDNSEYSLVPLKIEESKFEKLRSKLKE